MLDGPPDEPRATCYEDDGHRCSVQFVRCGEEEEVETERRGKGGGDEGTIEGGCGLRVRGENDRTQI